MALRRQQGAGTEGRDSEAAALAARKRAYRARLRCVQMTRAYPHHPPNVYSGKLLYDKNQVVAGFERATALVKPTQAPALASTHMKRQGIHL